MAVTLADQLAAPNSEVRKKGRYTLNQIVPTEESVAAPTVWQNVSHVQAVSVDKPTPDDTAILLQQGCGDEKTTDEAGATYNGNILVFGGKVGDVLAQLRDITWGAAPGYAGMPFRRPNDIPSFHWFACCRKKDNVTIGFNVLLQDVILDSVAFDNPMDYADGSIPFHCYHDALYIKTGFHAVYDQWAGDGSTVEFTMSKTPVPTAKAADFDDFDWDNLVSLKVKLTGETFGTRQKSGATVATNKITFTTAPAASSTVQALYICAD